MNPIPIKRDLDLPVFIMASGVDKADDFFKLHCMYCGKPLVMIRNKLVMIVDNPGAWRSAAVAIQPKCGRCGQRYNIVA